MTLIRTFAFAALLASTLAAQTPPATSSATPPPPPKAAEPDLATLRAMKSKLYVIQFRDAMQLLRTLSALGSGANGAIMRFNNDGGLNTIGVRDFPENLAVIEEAIKRLDVPLAISKLSDVELTIHVLFASKNPAPETGLPKDLQPVIQQLKGTLAYRGYTLAATFIQRWDLSSNLMIQGRGLVDGAGLGFGTAKEPSQLRIDWEATQAFGNAPKLTGDTLQIPKFQLTLQELNTKASAKVETSVNMKEGEHVVVGTSVIKDQGLIVVLTARRVN